MAGAVILKIRGRRMKIATSWSLNKDTSAAATEAYRSLLERLGNKPDLIVSYATALHDIAALAKVLADLSPGSQGHGATSCLGVMTEEGYHSNDGYALALWAISDPEGNYGVGAAPIGEDPRAAASAAMQMAVKQAGRPGEIPSVVLLTTAPGNEESILRGISDVVGPDVPVAGGSAADNYFEGQWKLFNRNDVFSDAVVVTAAFPSTPVGYAFESGHVPTEHTGRITRTSGRVIYEIDGRGAADIYQEWVEGAIPQEFFDGTASMSVSTLRPLGRIVGTIGGIPYYRLAHAAKVTPEGGLVVLADLEEGDEVTLMCGTKESLISRAGRVAKTAVDDWFASRSDVAGAMLFYCAGCLMTVDSNIDDAVSGVCSTLDNTPFIGMITFGEQGCFFGGENRHGNLMNTVLLFGARL